MAGSQADGGHGLTYSRLEDAFDRDTARAYAQSQARPSTLSATSANDAGLNPISRNAQTSFVRALPPDYLSRILSALRSMRSSSFLDKLPAFCA